MTDNPHNFPSGTGTPPPCECGCGCRKPQLNTTVTGRYSGCATCLCGSDESERISQQSTGMDGIQRGMTSIRLQVDGAVQCCYCCERRPERVVNHAIASASSQSGPPSIRSHGRRCGPWELRDNGDFVLREQDWESSTDGRFSYRFSLELRYNNTRCPSTATQPPMSSFTTFESSPATTNDGGGGDHSTSCCNTGKWVDAAFERKHYLCACPQRVNAQRSPTVLDELMTVGTEMHSAYPEKIQEEDV